MDQFKYLQKEKAIQVQEKILILILQYFNHLDWIYKEFYLPQPFLYLFIWIFLLFNEFKLDYPWRKYSPQKLLIIINRIHNKKLLHSIKIEIVMMRQEITPWSIYNKTIVNNPQENVVESTKLSIRFPKIKKKSEDKIQQNKLIKRRNSAKNIEQQKKKLDKFVPYQSSFPIESDEDQQKQRIKKIQMEHNQQQITKAFKDMVLLQYIKSQLKRDDSQEYFLSLIQQDKKQHNKSNIELINRDKSLLLDRHIFPRVNIQKNVMLVNLNQQDSITSQQKSDLNSYNIKQILKKEISSMISNRMKIMGKSKQINYKF